MIQAAVPFFTGKVDDFIGWNFSNNSNDPSTSSNSHGTSTAGILVGDGTNVGEVRRIGRLGLLPLNVGAYDDYPSGTIVEPPELPQLTISDTSVSEGAGDAALVVTISGQVLNTACEPVAGAKIDFWQTDAAGDYDNAGYRLRGHQYTGEDGAYSLETIVPGEYPGRPAHIHLKIFSPDGREALTSQLYIPGISESVPDGAFDRALLVRLAAGDGGRQQAFFDFIVR